MSQPVTEREAAARLAAADEIHRDMGRRITDLERRVGELDLHGSRGMTAVSVQLGQVIKDLGSLEARLDNHEKQHQQEARDRRGDRWKLAGIAAALIGPVYPLLAVLLARH